MRRSQKRHTCGLSLPFWFLIGLASCPIGACQSQPSIAQKAIDFCMDEANGKPELSQWAESCRKQDPDALYRVARLWNEKYADESLELYKFLANTPTIGHAKSIAELGLFFAKEGPDQSYAIALHYFQRAADAGHHPSMYNTGHLLAEGGEGGEGGEVPPDWVGSLAYLRAAATLHETHPEDAQEKITEVSVEAFATVSKRVVAAPISLKVSADVFLYGSLNEFSDSVESLWTKAANCLVRFNDTFTNSNGRYQDVVALRQSAAALRNIWEHNAADLSAIQRHILLHNINYINGPLAAIDDDFLPMAAGYAESWALTPFCWDSYARFEQDSSCFNEAVSNAISYYRRANDQESIDRVFTLGNSHPTAATHWPNTLQTPRVYHVGLSSKPWWKSQDFSAVKTLVSLYQDSSGQILMELDSVKKLKDESSLAQGQEQWAIQIDAGGHTRRLPSDPTTGLQRFFTKDLRTTKKAKNQSGAGGWAGFGPLFDGITWSEEYCRYVPTICKALQDDPSLCTAIASHQDTTLNNKDVLDLCGSDSVVTILRLRPGTTLLPHSGASNSRLIMQFPLEGAKGVEITVGGVVVKDYGGGNGHAIVFDDSYEHSIYHGGETDRFVVQVVLAHGDLL